ncbi:MAG: AAA domain-containing protein, partial [Candidatus Kapabacteria bacterium]|nr:AAA domain-containing protein [Candidatus Kapabacteria bacterium]MDW7997746.1 AAA domain-containing protein [Bacteroidota bacterium]
LVGDSAAMQSALKQMCEEHFSALHRLASLLRQKPLLVEPAFLAPLFGMQGRLDVLVLDAEGKPETLVELKAGTPPQRNAWEEHRAQVVCYSLLLQATVRCSAQRQWLFYCRDPNFPLRELCPRQEDIHEVLRRRNRIVWEQWQLSSGTVRLETLLQTLRVCPGWEDIVSAYEGLQSEEKAYVEEMCRFLLREQWGQLREFVVSTRAVPPTEGYLSGKGLTHLSLDPEATDWQRLHLCFRRTEHTTPVSPLRLGDPVVLYPMNAQGESLLFAAPVLKGVLRQLGEEELWVSLRNKYVEPHWCRQWHWWGIQMDVSDQFLEAQWTALGRFLVAPPERRQRLLGVLAPRKRHDDVADRLPLELSPDQKQLIKQALAAADYALIQGPPGTGKTAVVLRTLVERLLCRAEETLLIVACTNRAVDEICRTLQASGIAFMRLGTREGTDFPEMLPSVAAEGMGATEFAQWFQQCRVVVATVASALMTAELMMLKRFTTLLVDEASQLLESHLIGLLCSVERAILIGDERQLPAIVLQGAEEAVVQDEGLRRLGFVTFAESLFERLLRQCIHNGWDYAYGMLQRQARMHELLQQFPSVTFYGGKLLCAGLVHQQGERPCFTESPQTAIEELVSRHRLLFVDCAPETEAYGYHTGEVALVTQLVASIARLWGATLTERSIGVITPYRLQARMIFQGLPRALRRYVTVDTVERFQGSERDSIIVSLAVNHPWELRFLQSLARLPDGSEVDRKLNVMLTRARQQFVLVGSSDVLRQSVLYRRLLAFIQRYGCSVRAEDLRPMLLQEPPLS